MAYAPFQMSQRTLENDEEFGKYLMDKIKNANPVHKTFLKVTLLENFVTTAKNMRYINSIEEISDEKPPEMNATLLQSSILSPRNDYSIKLEPGCIKQEIKEEPVQEEVQQEGVQKKTRLVEIQPEYPDYALTYEHDSKVTRLADHQFVSAYMRVMLQEKKYKRVVNNRVEPKAGRFVARTFRVEKMNGRTMVYEKVRAPEGRPQENGPLIRRLPLVASPGDGHIPTFPAYDKDPDLKQFWEDLKKL